MSRALVTGATAGIGRAFVDRLAASGSDVVLVARDEARLHAVAREVRERHGVEVEVLPADLSDRAACARVEARLAAGDIDTLVNNAGYALDRSFLDDSVEAESDMLEVMVRAVLRLSHAAGTAMVGRGRGRIINVASVAAWVPFGTYSAHKAWVVVFSESLAAQLAGSGVTVTAVCPGFTRTEFHARATMSTAGIPDAAWLAADRVAREGLAAATRGHVLSIPSKRYRALAGMLRHAPRPLLRPATGSQYRPGAAAQRSPAYGPPAD